MMDKKRIIWEKQKLKRGITAFNNLGDELGWLQLEKIGQHMHWCWYQNEDIRMSPSCLQEVRDMQKQLFTKRKIRRKNNDDGHKR